MYPTTWRQHIFVELISTYEDDRPSYDPHEFCYLYEMQARAEHLPDASAIDRKKSFSYTWVSIPNDTCNPRLCDLSSKYCSLKASSYVIFERFTIE